MKKIYSLAAIVLLTCSASFGQVEIKLWDNGTQSVTGNAINGEEHTYSISTDGLHNATINFKNTSAVTKTWKMERYRITDAALWEDYFSWGIYGDPIGQCYSSGQMNTNPWMSPDMLSLTVSSGESVNLVANTQTQGAGTEKYRFYLIEGQATRVDSVDVTVITSLLGIANQQQEEEVSVAVYPNPVANTLTVSTKGLEGAIDLKIVDVLGKTVLTESGASSNKVDISSFRNGVYLVSIYNKGNLVQTKRIVVKH